MLPDLCKIQCFRNTLIDLVAALFYLLCALVVLALHADILYVTARTPSATFKAAMDMQALRLMTVDMPNTLSFGNILTGLGVTGAASLGDIITVSNTTVVYVPAVNGSGVCGVHRMWGCAVRRAPCIYVYLGVCRGRAQQSTVLNQETAC
jgi:hypothetical protein